jgi:hypothetical protein
VWILLCPSVISRSIPQLLAKPATSWGFNVPQQWSVSARPLSRKGRRRCTSTVLHMWKGTK